MERPVRRTNRTAADRRGVDGSLRGRHCRGRCCQDNRGFRVGKSCCYINSRGVAKQHRSEATEKTEALLISRTKKRKYATFTIGNENYHQGSSSASENVRLEPPY